MFGYDLTTYGGMRGLVMTVAAAGRGPTAVAIHGFPLDHRMWADQLGVVEGRRLLAPDLRGSGGTPWVGDPVHTMDLLADDVASVIRSASSDGADVVGLSMGGYVALALVERHPDLVRSLVLCATRTRPDTDEARARRDATIEAVVSRGRESLADAMLEVLVPADADPLVRARLRTMVEQTPTESIVASLRGMRDRPDRTEVLARSQVPVLVVVGEEDALVGVAEAEEMAEVADGRLEVIPGVGHMPPMEAPSIFNALLEGFWRAGGRDAR